MRMTLFALTTSALLAGVCLVGCGGDDSPITDGGIIDGLPFFPGDIGGGNRKVGCKSFTTCMVDCVDYGGQSATLENCLTTCNKVAKGPTVQTQWLDMLDCGQSYCLGNVDAGGYKCTLDSSGTVLVDRTGDPTDTCGNCLNDSLAAAFGSACMNMSSPDCNPTACKSVSDACLNDTP